MADYYGWDVATWYWEKNGIKEAIDDGTADILSVSKGVNTGSMTSKITPNDLEGREKGI